MKRPLRHRLEGRAQLGSVLGSFRKLRMCLAALGLPMEMEARAAAAARPLLLLRKRAFWGSVFRQLEGMAARVAVAKTYLNIGWTLIRKGTRLCGTSRARPRATNRKVKSAGLPRGDTAFSASPHLLGGVRKLRALCRGGSRKRSGKMLF